LFEDIQGVAKQVTRNRPAAHRETAIALVEGRGQF
jgi:hypothetical protein